MFDYDWAFRDDFMGEASVSLTRFLDQPTTSSSASPSELLVSLSDPGSKSGQEYLGQVALSLRLEPRRSADRSASILSALSHSEKQVRR